MGLTLCTAAKPRSAAVNRHLINTRKLYYDALAGKRRALAAREVRRGVRARVPNDRDFLPAAAFAIKP